MLYEVAVIPLGLLVAVYEYIAAPPVTVGATHDRLIEPDAPIVAKTEVGGPGFVTGTIMIVDGVDWPPVVFAITLIV